MKTGYWITILVVVITLAGISLMALETSKPAEIELHEDSAMITGSFGTELLYEDITDITLVDTIPEIGWKVSGAGLDSIRRGKYNVDGLGTVRLYVDLNVEKFIKIEYDNRFVFINSIGVSNTEYLFKDLLEACINNGSCKEVPVN